MNEIEKLKAEYMTLSSDNERGAFAERVKAEFNSKSEAEKTAFANAFAKSATESIAQAESVYNYVNIRIKLEPILKIVSLSYIAEHYFGKSRAWLSQRLNNNNVNNRPTSFTNGELKTLSGALDDIAGVIKNTARSIA